MRTNARGQEPGRAARAPVSCTAMLDGLPGAQVGSFRAAFPELAVTNDVAVIAPTALIVAVVPVMLGTGGLAVTTLRRDAEVDQEPGESPTQPRAPFVGMASHVLTWSPIRLTARR